VVKNARKSDLDKRAPQLQILKNIRENALKEIAG